MRHGGLVAAFALLALPAAADAKLRLSPQAGVPGAAIELRGFKGKLKSVTVAGRKAALLARPARFVVPAGRAGRRRVVVRSSRGRSRARLRVLAPFTGRFKATPDSSRAVTRTIGPAGGTLSGPSFSLTVPAGALKAAVAIKVTPLKSVAGLPGETAGVRLQPAGTTFSTPATLVLRLRKAARVPLAGLHTGSDGTGARWIATAKAGRSVALELDHFSDAVALALEQAAYASLLEYVQDVGDYTDSELEDLLGQLDALELIQPGSCARQPLCAQVRQALAQRITARALDICPGDQRVVMLELERLAALSRRLAVDPQDFRNCIQATLGLVIQRAAEDGLDQPHQSSSHAALDTNEADFGAADYDGNGLVNRLEWMVFLMLEATRRGFTPELGIARGYVDVATRRMREHGLTLCSSSQPAGLARLQSALAAVSGLSDLEAELSAAISACTIGMTISPTQITVAPGETVQFAATGRPGEAFTWSSTPAGAVSPSGLYTAPEAIGPYSVTATSVQWPDRSISATVNVADLATAVFGQNGGNINNDAEVDPADGEETVYSGNCGEVVPISPTAASYTNSRTCTATSSLGNASNTSMVSFTRSPPGAAFRTLQGNVRSEGQSVWNDPEESPGLAIGLADPVLSVSFEITKPTPYRLTGTVSASASGDGAEVLAQYDISRGGTPLHYHPRETQGSESFTDEGILEPGAHSFTVYVVSRARSAAPPSDSGLASSATAEAQAKLELNP